MMFHDEIGANNKERKKVSVSFFFIFATQQRFFPQALLYNYMAQYKLKRQKKGRMGLRSALFYTFSISVFIIGVLAK